MTQPVLIYRYLTGNSRPTAGQVITDGAMDSAAGNPEVAGAPVILCCNMDTIVTADADGTMSIPTLTDLLNSPARGTVAAIENWHLVATSGDTPVYAAALKTDELDAITSDGAPAFTRSAWRSTLAGLDDQAQYVLGRGMQIARWFATSRYCSACATPTEFVESEPVARCPACGHVQYPRVAPAMIVSVLRDGKILLAQSPRFRGGFHSVLAGFVEPGESVEECVHREVCEEAGVTVKNLRYFGSQSWAMPHSLMLAYIADWDKGEISIDQDELVHADWYDPHDLPNVPGEVSIAGRMIRWFREEYG